MKIELKYNKTITVSIDIERLETQPSIHNIVHGRGVGSDGERLARALALPVGETIAYRWNSHRYLYDRRPGGLIVLVGQVDVKADNGENWRIDTAAIHHSDTVRSVTFRQEEGRISAIQRDNRDAVPVRSNEIAIEYVRSVIEGKTEIGDAIGFAQSRIKDSCGLREFYYWFSQFGKANPTSPYVKGRINQTFTAYLKERIKGTPLPLETQRALGWQALTAGVQEGGDTVLYNEAEEKFITSRNCDLAMTKEDARLKFVEGRNFNTPWGMFKFGTEWCVCGCHKFSRAHLEHVIGITAEAPKAPEVSLYEKTRLDWQDKLQVMRQMNSTDSEAEDRAMEKKYPNPSWKRSEEVKAEFRALREKQQQRAQDRLVELYTTAENHWRPAIANVLGDEVAAQFVGNTKDELHDSSKKLTESLHRRGRAAFAIEARAEGSQVRQDWARAVDMAKAELAESEARQSLAAQYQAQSKALENCMIFNMSGGRIDG